MADEAGLDVAEQGTNAVGAPVARRRPRYATTGNPTLAGALDLALFARRCAAFRARREFVLSP